jgi:uncharacterized membrane protein YdjX (TVP38/TMEM64 family)
LAKKLALVVCAGALLLIAHQLGAFEAVSHPHQLKEAILRLGSLGFLGFVLAFAFLQPFGVPGILFVLGASLVWPPPLAIVLSLLGTAWASVNGFGFARYVARDWVEKRMPPRWRKYDERLATRGFTTVFVLRLILWMNPFLHAAFGLSRVRFSTHLAATVLGCVPSIVAFSYLGDRVLSLSL